MKTRSNKKPKLVYGGKNVWEKTNQFKNRVNEIKKEVTDKYSETLLNERNFGRRILIKVRIIIEISRRIERLSSLKNLHILSH